MISSLVHVAVYQATGGIATVRDVRLVSSMAVVFVILQEQAVTNAKTGMKKVAIFAFVSVINTARTVLKGKIPMHVRNVKRGHIYIKVLVIRNALLGLL